MSYPTFDEIRRLRDAEMASYAHSAKSGRDLHPGYASLAASARRPLLPLYRDVLCDLETPVSAYCKTAKGPYSFLLESVTGGEHAARFSLIGIDPYLSLHSEGKRPRSIKWRERWNAINGVPATVSLPLPART